MDSIFKFNEKPYQFLPLKALAELLQGEDIKLVFSKIKNIRIKSIVLKINLKTQI